MDNIQMLQESYSRVSLIPVIGSGISKQLGLPDWRTLIEMSAEHFSIADDKQNEINDYLNKYKFIEAVDIILNNGVDEYELQQYVSECIYEAKSKSSVRDSNYSDLALMSKIRYMTTNYDQYINDIIGAESFCLENLENIQINQFGYSIYDHTVIPLHGEISRPESIVLSRNSYNQLYDTKAFNEQFQQLRTRFTFLFIGFSFEDEYVQKLFDKIIQRFEAQHFILFDESVKEQYPSKIENLRDRYGIEAIFYDSSVNGHTEGIRSRLSEIFKLRDRDVNIDSLEILPESKKLELEESEKSIINRGHDFIQKELLTDLYALYNIEYQSVDFKKKSILFQIEIICGLAWYYGYQRKDKEALEFMNISLEDSLLSKYKNKFVFMYGQILWNARQFEKGIAVLEAYNDSSKLIQLLLDILKLYKKYLPEYNDMEDEIPVYSEYERSDDEKAAYHLDYIDLKERYINVDTYNLIDVDSYENRESQYIAYYWLGIATGQLFHEHAEAVQYLHRAKELNSLVVVHEELANNYFALASEKIRYERYPQKHQLNMDYLIKARIWFQYIMNFSDQTVVHSLVERSGFAYLQTLYWVKDYIAFYEFYNMNKEYLTETKDLTLLKAEVDAEYEHTVEEETLKKLDLKDKRYIEYLCAFYRAELFSVLNPVEANRIRYTILAHAQEDKPIDDRRVIQIIIDTAFFSSNIKYYESLKDEYPAKYFEDMQRLGLEDELYGRIDGAERKIKDVFEEHKDFDGTYRIIKGFYIRNNKKTEYEELFKELEKNPPDEMYKSPRFYADHVLIELNEWRNQWNAMELYNKYYEQISADTLLIKEIEETLKVCAADYRDYRDRIAWNRYMLTKVPKYAKCELYLSILKLYVANARYSEAASVLDEMKKLKVPIVGNFDKLIYVCLRPQKNKKYYVRKIRPYYRADNEYLQNLLNEADKHLRYRYYSFGLSGEELILSIRYLLCVFRQNRQKELAEIGKIHIMYAGVINLQNSLWAEENAFLRMILQWISGAKNVVLSAPDFREFCKIAPSEKNVDHRAEDIQIKLYSMEHPECFLL